MPKRVKTPPPPDDEPRYLAILHPFGTTADGGRCTMALPQHQRDFARWVACCIDQEVFLSFYHRPSSGDVAIIEVKRDYPHLDRILGEHRWSEFLINPPADVQNDVSCVYHCTHNSGRELQKHGWKLVPVEDDWFRSWSPKNKFIRFPYPPTRYCDLPQGLDRTVQSLFRPLPRAVIALPLEIPVAPPPVVGSEAWLQARDGPEAPPAPRTKATGKASSKGAPKSRAQQSTRITQVNVPGGKRAAVGGGNAVAKVSTVWQVPNPSSVSGSNWDEQSITGPASETSGSISPVHVKTNAPLGVISPSGPSPPGLGPPPGLAPRPSKSAWTKGPPTNSVTAANPWGPPPGLGPARTVNSSSSGMGCYPSGTDVDSWPYTVSTPANQQTTHPDTSSNPYAVQVPVPDSMLNVKYGNNTSAGGYDYDVGEEDDELADMNALMPGVQSVVTSSSLSTFSSDYGGPDIDKDNSEDDRIWGLKPSDDAEAFARRASPAQSNASGNSESSKGWAQLGSESGANDDNLCPAHGMLCKKGICREYAEKKRKKQWAEERAQRTADAANDRGRGRGSGRGWRSSGSADQSRGGRGNAMYRGRGAQVKTNWKGAPRELKDLSTALEEESAMSRTDGTDTGHDSDDGRNAWNAVPSADWGLLPTSPTPDGTDNHDADGLDATTESHEKPISPVPEDSLETRASIGKGKSATGVKVAKASWKNTQNGKKAQDQRQSQTQSMSNTQGQKQSQTQKQPKGSWADQVEDASAAGWDDAKSGWGTVSEGPW